MEVNKLIDETTKNLLKTMWDYMVLDMDIPPKLDLIIGCGCENLEIPVRCSNLIKKGYANYIIFSGGLGKITSKIFNISEAEIYKQIAIENGIDGNKILIENKSTNTGNNFRFSIKIIEEANITDDKILIVHSKFSERRTLATAKAIITDKELYITSPNISFEEYINRMNQKEDDLVKNIISVIVGDVQRMIIFPQFGWQIEQDVPQNVLNAYNQLKELGYIKFVFNVEQIQQLIDTNNILDCKQANYFN